ncbi:MAG TPA: hypothetical protein VNO21_23740, partial [Polyangiaceae bacterium]|nr:hypothetical protein [Polyangiaceae bacterium]
MAEESKAGGLNPIPPALADDHEDVSWALSTAKSTWDRGEHMDALKWLRRAVEAASEAEADDRALTLAKAAADLATTIDELGWDLGTIRPPPTAPASPEAENFRPTVRLSPIVVPAAPPAGAAGAPDAVPGRLSTPSAPAAPPPRLSTPNPSPAPGRVSQGRISQTGPTAVPRPTQPTGAALLGNASRSSETIARPSRPSLGLLGPRPKTGDTPIHQIPGQGFTSQP